MSFPGDTDFLYGWPVLLTDDELKEVQVEQPWVNKTAQSIDWGCSYDRNELLAQYSKEDFPMLELPYGTQAFSPFAFTKLVNKLMPELVFESASYKKSEGFVKMGYAEEVDECLLRFKRIEDGAVVECTYFLHPEDVGGGPHLYFHLQNPPAWWRPVITQKQFANCYREPDYWFKQKFSERMGILISGKYPEMNALYDASYQYSNLKLREQPDRRPAYSKMKF